MEHPLVITVILNTNRREDTLAALASLENSSYSNHKIIVLDNASTDGSVQAIRSNHPQVRIIQLTENLGYAGNNNVGIEAAVQDGTDWVFVLNEDTVLASDCIERMISVGEMDTNIGVMGPMVYHHNEPEIIQSAGGRLSLSWQSEHIAQNERDTGQFSSPVEVDWISGCAILVRKEVIQQVGSLDNRFFYYWEETEWCLRAKKGGWKIVHVPHAKLWHKGVQRDYQPGPNVTYYSTRNRFLVLEKHNAPLKVRLQVWAQTLRTLASWSVRPKWRLKREHRNAIWQGLLDYLRRRWGMRST